VLDDYRIAIWGHFGVRMALFLFATSGRGLWEGHFGVLGLRNAL
jgi:hypothetical protein